MELTAFKMRRVMMGVLVGLLVVSVAFYGWVQYRQSQYHEREKDVLAQYQRAYSMCTAAGTAPFLCLDRVMDACVRDPFWQMAKPFSFDVRVGTPDPVTSCRAKVPTS